MIFNATKFRENFDFFSLNPKLIFFDSSAISLVPKIVIDKTLRVVKECPLSSFRSVYSHNIESGISETRKKTLDYFLDENMICDFEAQFGLNASEIFFKIVTLYIQKSVKKSDIIILSKLSHHTLSGAASYLKDFCTVLWIEELGKEVNNEKIKYIFLQHISNITGYVNVSIDDIENYKKKYVNAKIVIDISQSFGFINKELFSKCDIIFFSAHKYLGLTGLGVAIIRKNILFDNIFSFPSGGNISKLHNNFTIDYSRNTFELGTLNSVSIISFLFALQFMSDYDFTGYLIDLNNYFVEKAKHFYNNKIEFIGCVKDTKPVFSFYSTEWHPHDIGDFLLENNILVRSGTQCCTTCFVDLPNKVFDEGVTRVSFFPYNTREEIDYFFDTLMKI